MPPHSQSPVRRGLACVSIAANVLCAGGVFTIPLITPALAQHVKLTQPQLTSIVLAAMAGQYPCTPLVGKIVDSYGPWACSLIASLLFSVAFGCFSFLVHRMLEMPTPPPETSVYLLIILSGLAGIATVFAYFSSLFAATRSFPSYPGAAAGTVMALFGLSPLFLSFIASNFFAGRNDASLNVVGFLAFLAILTGVVHILGALNLCTPKDHPPIALSSQDEEASETTPLLSESRSSDPHSFLDLLREPSFWVLFLLLTVTLGPCEMIISNIGTIVLSLPSGSATVFSGVAAAQVQTLAISNTVTRLLTGPIADFVSPVVSHVPTVRKHYISRAAFLVAPAAALAFTSFWMELGVRSQGDVWVLSLSIRPSIISSIWGADHAGRNFGIIVFAPLTGTTLFSYLYAFVAAYHTSGDGFCRGRACWQTTFWVAGALQMVAILGGLILWRGWRGLL
ncbi:MFS general substrate transporter [Mycena pura]|uniref:Probable transporter MCH1 n=1 Tax=Mycena pura TaxID=153505 RepID=A0AAD6VPG4_9AGAR|nr:MFS general substrate transporter [Mycena pura]